MVNRRISSDLKACALQLWRKGWKTDDICDSLGISFSSLYRWQRVLDEFGAVERPQSPLCGRTHILTRAILTAVEILYKDNPDTFYDEIQSWLAVHHDISISISTLQRNISDAGLT